MTNPPSMTSGGPSYQLAVKKMGYAGVDVAQFPGITPSAVNRLAVSDELPETVKYL